MKDNFSEEEDLRAYRERLISKMFSELPFVFPELNFTYKGGRWLSPMHLDGVTRDSEGRGCLVSNKIPYIVCDFAKGKEEIITYYRKRHNLESKEGFKEALDQIADIVGEKRFNFGQKSSEALEAYERKQAAFQGITKEASEALFSGTPDALEVLNYMRGRGWTDEEIRAANLGYIDGALRAKYSSVEGLFPPEAGSSHRLLLPIKYSSDIAHLKFRDIHEAESSKKYRNTKGAKKSSFLAEIGFNSNNIVIVEGELDAMHVKAKGFKDIAATQGGALSEAQLLEIVSSKRKITSLTFLFDADEAGRQFTRASLDIVERVAPTFNCYVMELPEGFKDTDEFFGAGKSIEDWKQELSKRRASHLWEEEQIFTTSSPSTDAERAELLTSIEQLSHRLKYHETEGFFGIVEENSSKLGVLNAEKFVEYLRAQNLKNKKEKQRAELEARIKGLKFATPEEGVKQIETLKESFASLIREESFAKVFVHQERGDFEKLLARVPRGLPTGFKFTQHRGINNTEEELLTFREGLSFVVGYRGHYKTTLLNTLMLEQLKHSFQDEAILYYSLEIDKRRALANLLNTWIDDETLSKDRRKPLDTILEYYRTKNINLISQPSRADFRNKEASFFDALTSQRLVIVGEDYSSEELASSILYYKKTLKRKIRAVFIDYVQLLESEEAGKNTLRTEELKQILSSLRKLANEEGLPIIMACQTNRIESPSELITKNIGESASIEREADTIIGLYALKEFNKDKKEERAYLLSSIRSALGGGVASTDADYIKEQIDAFFDGKSDEAKAVAKSASEERGEQEEVSQHNLLLCRLMKRRGGISFVDTYLKVRASTGKVCANNYAIWNAQQGELDFTEETAAPEPDASLYETYDDKDLPF